MPNEKTPLFYDIIEQRRSTRKFQAGRDVSKTALKRIVDCGRWAPSGANVQCWDFIVVDDPQMIKRVTEVFLKALG